MGQLRTANKRHNRAIVRANDALHAAVAITPVKVPAKTKSPKKPA